jgi:hypothetical protein
MQALMTVIQMKLNVHRLWWTRRDLPARVPDQRFSLIHRSLIPAGIAEERLTTLWSVRPMMLPPDTKTAFVPRLPVSAPW